MNAAPRAELALLKSRSDSPELRAYSDALFVKGICIREYSFMAVRETEHVHINVRQLLKDGLR